MAWRKNIVDWLDLRLGIRDLLEQNLTKYLLPRNINVWYTLGAVLITLFVLQVATGILLLIYYVPDPAEAFQSVTRIMNEVPSAG
jgi:ubiquinol-cytochrome c reductase cytochrome b subunit